MSSSNELTYDLSCHRLKLNGQTVEKFTSQLDKPISVILQITRNCHFNCSFCSEIKRMPDPTLEELKIYASHLKGVPRIFLSGGEPLTRTDFSDVVDIFKDNHILGLPTNAVASKQNIQVIKNNNMSVNIGLDGPRNITSTVRGDYDFIMRGIREFIKNDISFSLTSVVLRSTMDSVLYTCQIADALGAKKLKFVLPIPKGNALNLEKNEYISSEEAQELCLKIKETKSKLGWTTTYTFTTWNEHTNGYSILVYPNGKTYAWPVLNEDDKVLFLGDLHVDTIADIWSKYPYKFNHVNKYLGDGICVI